LDFFHTENFEQTRLQTDTFPFNCFHIKASNTLPHWHNHLEIIYISKETSEVYINGNLYLLGTGDILIVPPNSLHSILPLDMGDYYAIVVGETLLSSIIEDDHINKSLQPIFRNRILSPVLIEKCHADYPFIVPSMGIIIKEVIEKSEHYESLIKIELCRFYTLVSRYFAGHLPEENRALQLQTQKFKKAIEYIAIHYQEKITIADISRHMDLSEQHFCRLFKANTGKTFVEHLTQYRLEQARRLLLCTDMQVTRIPELTGFCNPNYFARIYKKHYGESPSVTRKQSEYSH